MTIKHNKWSKIMSKLLKLLVAVSVLAVSSLSFAKPGDNREHGGNHQGAKKAAMMHNKGHDGRDGDLMKAEKMHDDNDSHGKDDGHGHDMDAMKK